MTTFKQGFVNLSLNINQQHRSHYHIKYQSPYLTNILCQLHVHLLSTNSLLNPSNVLIH